MESPNQGSHKAWVAAILICCLMAAMGWILFEGTMVLAERVRSADVTIPTRPTPPETLPPTRDPTTAITMTATATPTPTHTPTPRPAVLPMVWHSLISIGNGDFETGTLHRWAESGDLPKMVVEEPVHDGQYAALLGSPSFDNHGGCPSGESAISQVIEVPSVGHPVLKVWYRLYSYDTIQFDYFAIDIQPYPDGTAEQLWIDGRIVWSQGVPWNSGWREASINLDNYRGQTVAVRLYNAMTNDDGYYNTWTYVDDVTLE